MKLNGDTIILEDESEMYILINSLRDNIEITLADLENFEEDRDQKLKENLINYSKKCQEMLDVLRDFVHSTDN